MSVRYNPILFDLDGTLVDSGLDIAESVNRTLKAHDLPHLPAQEIISFVGDGVRKLIERTLARVGRNNVDEMVIAMRADYRENCLVHTASFPGIAELLRDLKEAKVAVVTNKVADFAHIILDGLNLAPYIQVVVGGDETEKIKPHPDPILLACRRLGTDPTRGIMVGDHANDILAGRDSGMTTCGVLWGFDRGKSVDTTAPDHTCLESNDLRELLLLP